MEWNLPALTWISILKYLNFEDRIRCRQVCKNWRDKIGNLYGREALFCYFDVYPRNLKWSYTNKLIGIENSIRITTLSFLKHTMTTTIFYDVRRLILFNLDQQPPQRSMLIGFERYISHFRQLIQLELNGFNFENETILDFPKLKILTLKDISQINMDYCLNLNTPQLEILICWNNISNVRFLVEPIKLKHLECVLLSGQLRIKNQFPNLEIIYLFDVTNQPLTDFLNYFPRLKKLNIYNNFDQVDLDNLYRKKLQNGMNDLQILFLGMDEGVYMRPSIGYNLTYILQSRHLKCLAENYLSLNESVTWNVYLDYCELILKFELVPTKFFQKFQRISIVHVGKLNDQQMLIDFLHSCGYVKHLRIGYSNLKQSFYNQLPSTSVSILEIIDDSSTKIQNYRFIRKLQIFELRFHLDVLPVAIIQNLLLNSYIKYFNFKNVRLEIMLARTNDGHVVYFDRESLGNFVKANEIVYYLKRKRLTKGVMI